MTSSCLHLVASEEAYAVEADGATHPASVHLCEWPDQHPERFMDAPRWLLRMGGTGLAVSPERDCVKCPAFVKEQA